MIISYFSLRSSLQLCGDFLQRQDDIIVLENGPEKVSSVDFEYFRR